MAGNPFRRSQILNPAAAASSPAVSAVSYLNADGGSSTEGTVRDYDSGNASPPPPAKTKKSVRIESPSSSPPHPAAYSDYDPSPNRTYRGNDAGHPDPRSPAGFSDTFDDYASADPYDRGECQDSIHEARDMTGSKGRDPVVEAPIHSLSGAPVNPFSKTLATIEPQEKGGVESAHAGQQRGRTAAEKAGSATPKANLDVEGFKRLLMTGISGPAGSSQSPHNTAGAPNPVVAPAFESSSTDTSSVSRQSIFEHALQEPHVETPRTSYEMAPSDDDTLGLVTEVKKKEKKKPPPAPKHRHGKLVSSRAPQTVSFSDFEATEAISSPVPRRTNSNLNKPLPPTPSISSPASHIISQDISQDVTEDADPPPLETRTSDSSGHQQPPTSQKKVPPPVPLARRQSQLRSTKGNRSRSSSNLTISSQHSISEFPMLSPSIPSDAASSPSQKVPPPPPPTRRYGSSLTGNNPPSATSSTTELPSTARRSNVSSPNPPSSRRTTTLPSSTSSPAPEEPSLARTSSLSSNRNTPRSISNDSASIAPPPPPPRRRQSGRTSLDKERPFQYTSASPGESRRTSSEHKRSSIDGKRRTSVASESSLKYEYAPAADNEHVLYSPQEVEEPKSIEAATVSTGNTSDILDDMEKFQREIDELRERYQKELMKRLWMPAVAYGIV